MSITIDAPKKEGIITRNRNLQVLSQETGYGSTTKTQAPLRVSRQACRLIDTLHFTQEECARQMNVARSTVAAIYQSARAKIADALFYGKTLNFHGGDVELCKFHSECCGRCGQRDCAACGKCGKGKRLQ